MAKVTWRDRLKAHGFKFFIARWGYFGVSKDGDYVSGRRADVVISALERDRQTLSIEVERLRAEMVRSEKAKLHLIAKVKAPRVTDDMVERVTMRLLAHEKDPAPGIDWHCNRQWTVNKVRELMRAALEEVL